MVIGVKLTKLTPSQEFQSHIVLVSIVLALPQVLNYKGTDCD